MRYGLILTIVLITACEKNNLDSVAFPSEKLDSYQFENYDDWNFSIPDSMLIGSNNRTLLSFTSQDQANGKEYTIYGVYLGDTATIDQDSILLYCHGQSLHMDAYYQRASLLANIGSKLNYGVLMMDYRGYGRSEGESSEKGLIADVDVCIDFLKNHGAQEKSTFYYAFSLGAIPVIERAAYKNDFQPDKIILESPLASVEFLTQSSTVLNMDADFVTTLDFDNAGNIQDVSADLLWLHGRDDNYIDLDNGEIVYDNYQGSYRNNYIVEGANHGNVPEKMGFNLYLNRLESFLNN